MDKETSPNPAQRLAHIVQRGFTFSYEFLPFLVLFLYHSQPPYLFFQREKRSIAFFTLYFHWFFFPCPFTTILNWNRNPVMFKLELNLESDDMWVCLKLDKMSSPFLHSNAWEKMSTCLHRYGDWLPFSNGTEYFYMQCVQYLGYWVIAEGFRALLQGKCPVLRELVQSS